MNDMQKIKGADGKLFWATRDQAEAIEVLTATRKGGIAAVYGYKPSTGYVTQPVQDIRILTRFSTAALYERKKIALEAVTFESIEAEIPKHPKLAALKRNEAIDLFNARKQMVVDSMNKTLSGDRDDAHRQGHDRCYSAITEGIKVHFVTEKGSDGFMHPVLTKGFPTVASIMVNYLEISKTTRVPGERKTVNSGAPVLMGNLIENALNQKSVGFRTLSLKEDNFERLSIDKSTILSEDVASLM